MAQLSELIASSKALGKVLTDWSRELEELKVTELTDPRYTRIYSDANIQKHIKMLKEFHDIFGKETSVERKLKHAFTSSTSLFHKEDLYLVMTGPDAEALLAGKADYMTTHVINKTTNKSKLAARYTSEEDAKLNDTRIRIHVRDHGELWDQPIKRIFGEQKNLRGTLVRPGFTFTTGLSIHSRLVTLYNSPFGDFVVGSYSDEKEAKEKHDILCRKIYTDIPDKAAHDDFRRRCFSAYGIFNEKFTTEDAVFGE